MDIRKFFGAGSLKKPLSGGKAITKDDEDSSEDTERKKKNAPKKNDGKLGKSKTARVRGKTKIAREFVTTSGSSSLSTTEERLPSPRTQRAKGKKKGLPSQTESTSVSTSLSASARTSSRSSETSENIKKPGSTTGKSDIKSSSASKRSPIKSKVSPSVGAERKKSSGVAAKRPMKNELSPRPAVVHRISSSSESDDEVTVTSSSRHSSSTTPQKKPRIEAVSPADFFSNRAGPEKCRQHKEESKTKKGSPGKLNENNKSSNVKSEWDLRNNMESSPISSRRIKAFKTEKTPPPKDQSTSRKRAHDSEVSSEEVDSRPPAPKERRKTEETPRHKRSGTAFKESKTKQTPTRALKMEKNRTQKSEDEHMEVDISSSADGPSPKVTPKPKEARPSQGANYMAYLNREPPRHLGERTHPQGSPNCLKGFVVVMTGVMDYVEKDEIKEVVERCGGRITGNVSGKTTHLIAGRDSGPSKVSKAESMGAQVVDELGWFDLVESKTNKAKAFPAKKVADPVEDLMRDIKMTKQQTEDSTTDKGDVLVNKGAKLKSFKSTTSSSEKTDDNRDTEKILIAGTSSSPTKAGEVPALMWVDKYMPASTKQIIGQQGDKSNVAKLRHWLTKWSAKATPVFAGKFNRGTMDGSGMKAALLSGPPGVGKTTTAHLVAKELEYEVIELNASDTRSKRSLREEVQTLLSNRTLTEKSGKGHLLVMDEVDGMAGNEDRGGIAELIQLIKTTKVPILCICNDRSHPKMRSLVHYCFDLRFYKPQPKQIQAALMSICFKEGVKLPLKLLEEIVIASNQDIRQCIHSLNLYCALHKTNGDGKSREGSSDKAGSATSVRPIKDVRLGPFDAVKKLLVASEGGEKMSLNERQALFFNDYNAIPLFVQENYAQVTPVGPKMSRVEHLRRLARAAESICYGDTIEKAIRSSNAWALLPSQALFSAVIPSDEMRGNLRSMINFPRWFGHYSSTAKHRRQTQALHSHMSCRISADTFETAANYLPVINRKLVEPLIRDGEAGVEKVVSVMSAYSLQRADMEAINELATWGAATDRDRDPLQGVSSKVKAKLTRTLNKELVLPYATDDMIKAGGKKVKREPKKGARGVKGDPEVTEDNGEAEDFADDDDAGAAMDFM